MRRGIITWGVVIALSLTARAHAAWDSFQIIEWQARDKVQLETLKQIGVTAVAVIADRGDNLGTSVQQEITAPREAGLAWYMENVATDFYSSYHRYTPGKPVNWRFLAAQAQYHANPDDTAALFRDPSLADQQWRNKIRDRLTDTVDQQKTYHPLYYSLGDETGIADLAAYWDFDLSPPSVAGFRAWLWRQYGSLQALNTEWGTAYRTWDAVQPETTREAMRRTDDDYAAWNDFKAWMDTSFADALRMGTDAIHRADPAALSAVEGAQVPGWGGYDYTKLAHAVDVMEVYDGEENIPLAHTINPSLVPLVTSFGAGPAELHGIWRSVLRGARGLILWDEDNSIVRPDASPGPRAAAYAPVFAALRGDLGRRLIDAEPINDAVAILYSPVSFRLSWMLDNRQAGDAWIERNSEIEGGDSPWRKSMRDYTEVLSRMGLHPWFLTEEQLARGPPPVAALILPRAVALSDADIQAIGAFIAKGGKVIADVPPGVFDGHGKRRAVPPLRINLVPPADLPRVLTLAPAVAVDAPRNDVETWLYRSRGQRLLALQTRAAGTAAENVTVDLKGWHAHDLAGHDYGAATKVTLTLDPITPSFLELTR